MKLILVNLQSWAHGYTQQKKTWTEFATPSLEVLGNLEVQMYKNGPRV